MTKILFATGLRLEREPEPESSPVLRRRPEDQQPQHRGPLRQGQVLHPVRTVRGGK